MGLYSKIPRAKSLVLKKEGLRILNLEDRSIKVMILTLETKSEEVDQRIPKKLKDIK